MKRLLLTVVFCFLPAGLMAQGAGTDSALANHAFATAEKYFSAGQYDSSLTLYKEASAIYFRSSLWENFINCRNRIGRTYDLLGQYDTALTILSQALDLGKKHLGEKNKSVATTYNNLGIVYGSLSEYDKALEYYLKALKLREAIFGKKHKEVAQSYNNVAVAFQAKGEYDKALEYHYKALDIRKDLFGEIHQDIAQSYNNIGSILYQKNEYKKALEYILKALHIRLEIYGEKHPETAGSYVNAGVLCSTLEDYDNALAYERKALNIFRELYGDTYPDIAAIYTSIGTTYQYKGIYDTAYFYLSKALEQRKSLFGEKHPNVAEAYYNIGCMYEASRRYDEALLNFQHGLIADLIDFSDDNTYANPLITNFISADVLLNCLQAKSVVFFKKAIGCDSSETEINRDLNAAYSNIILCDRLIQQMRKSYLRESEKLSWNEKVRSVYDYAIAVCNELMKHTKKQKYSIAAFDYSEKSRMSALRDAIFDKEGMATADIPDSILEQEHSLRMNISLYEKKIAEMPDSAEESECRSKLFDLNRHYDDLIVLIEKEYPEYYNLKYDNKNISVDDLLKSLDNKTAIRSYFTGDNKVFVFTLTRTNLTLTSANKIKNLEDTIKAFRETLNAPDESDKQEYTRMASLLYQQLFPDSLAWDKSIENLVIIPDGILSTLPFEALLYENAAARNTAFKNMPFLIKRFTVSYTYSANLFYHTFSGSRQKKSGNMNDWLGFAPVFSEKDTAGLEITTRELQKCLGKSEDSTSVRKRSLIITKGSGISPLPGTENEVKSILREFEKKNLKGKALLHSLANKAVLKGDEAKQYNILHFATHGFVNSETPELSGILFAGDSTGGILSCGDIYNLSLNADLIVLSACETGLGKLKSGEGIMGLSRALLYAGARNLIVSLWQVSDNSTTGLMISFYRDMLKSKMIEEYAPSLRDAKLQMIKEGKYAHPFYWSPFILIGR